MLVCLIKVTKFFSCVSSIIDTLYRTLAKTPCLRDSLDDHLLLLLLFYTKADKEHWFQMTKYHVVSQLSLNWLYIIMIVIIYNLIFSAILAVKDVNQQVFVRRLAHYLKNHCRMKHWRVHPLFSLVPWLCHLISTEPLWNHW